MTSHAIVDCPLITISRVFYLSNLLFGQFYHTKNSGCSLQLLPIVGSHHHHHWAVQQQILTSSKSTHFINQTQTNVERVIMEREINESFLLPFLEFVLGYLKAPTTATEQHLNLCVYPLWHGRDVNMRPSLVHVNMLCIPPHRARGRLLAPAAHPLSTPHHTSSTAQLTHASLSPHEEVVNQYHSSIQQQILTSPHPVLQTFPAHLCTHTHQDIFIPLCLILRPTQYAFMGSFAQHSFTHSSMYLFSGH